MLERPDALTSDRQAHLASLAPDDPVDTLQVLLGSLVGSGLVSSPSATAYQVTYLLALLSITRRDPLNLAATPYLPQPSSRHQLDHQALGLRLWRGAHHEAT